MECDKPPDPLKRALTRYGWPAASAGRLNVRLPCGRPILYYQDAAAGKFATNFARYRIASDGVLQAVRSRFLMLRAGFACIALRELDFTSIRPKASGGSALPRCNHPFRSGIRDYQNLKQLAPRTHALRLFRRFTGALGSRFIHAIGCDRGQ